MKKSEKQNKNRLIALLVILALSIGVMTISLAQGGDLEGRIFLKDRGDHQILSNLSRLSPVK